MPVEMIESNYLPISYVYSARYGEGRVSLPVPRSQALYSNFRHVSGVPAQAGSPSYGVDKLHILEVLIGRLERIRSEPAAAAQAPESLDSDRVDALIRQYGAELKSAAKAPLVPYSLAPGLESGMLFSLAA